MRDASACHRHFHAAASAGPFQRSDDPADRLAQAPGHAQHAVVDPARLRHQPVNALAFQRDHVRAVREQCMGGGVEPDASLPCHQTATARFGQRGQARGIGRGAGQCVQTLVGSERRHRPRAVVLQTVAEQQVLTDALCWRPIGQVGSAVVHHRGQCLAQCAPVAAAHLERPAIHPAVTQQPQFDLAIAHRPEIAIQQFQLAGVVAPAAGGRRIPQQSDVARQDAWRRCASNGQFGEDVAFVTVHADVAARRGRRREAQCQSAGGCCIPALQFGALAIAVLAPAWRGERANQHRRLLRTAHMQRHVRRRRQQASGQAQQPLIAIATHRFIEHQPHLARATRRQRIHAQAEMIAGSLFEQGRVDVATLDALEHLAALLLRHRYRIAHHAIDVQGERGHLLARLQRELQRAFKDAGVRIAQGEQQGRAGEAARHANLHVGAFQHHRGFRARRLDPCGRRSRRLRPQVLRGTVDGDADGGNAGGEDHEQAFHAGSSVVVAIMQRTATLNGVAPLSLRARPAAASRHDRSGCTAGCCRPSCGRGHRRYPAVRSSPPGRG